MVKEKEMKADMQRRVFEYLAKGDPGDRVLCYNAACVHALFGNYEVLITLNIFSSQ